MSIIKLFEDDPIVSRAKALETERLSEIGFIPGDEYGCKIYARKKYGRLMLIGVHSHSYGCPDGPLTVGVEIMPLTPRKT